MAPSALPPADQRLPSASTTNNTAPAAGVKRKTPSELRQEQLDRAVRSRNSRDGAISALPAAGSSRGQQKKTNLRPVDTHAPTKPHDRSKDDFKKALSNGNVQTGRAFRRPIEDFRSIAAAKDVLPADSGSSTAAENQAGNFRDVTDLSSETKPQASGLALDMVGALKVMASAAWRGFGEITLGSGPQSQFPDSSSHIKNPLPDNLKRPSVDLSLKLSARFLSVDSLHWDMKYWCHGISSANEVEGVKLFVEKFEWDDEVNLRRQPDVLAENGKADRFGARFCQALHSWVHPSPQYLELYEIALASTRGDTKNIGILTRLFRTWEDSFRSLYYMFRHKHCNLFYVCTQQSVVMFERANNVDGKEDGSHVCWSRSTPGLRQKLQEQGLEFLMPFYTPDAGLSAPEDLYELTELEKLNPGHTRLVDPRAAINEDSQSLLFFDVDNVHRIFDFLLNYRFLIASGTVTDFPVLYSPVSFSKSSLYTPEQVKCRSIQRPIEKTWNELPTYNGSIKHSNEKVSDMLYSLELKGPQGAYITPWVIQAVCRLLQKSQKLGFEVSFVTGPLSENLNVVQDTLSSFREVEGEESKASLLRRIYRTDVSRSKMRVIKHLRYIDGSYQENMGGPS